MACIYAFSVDYDGCVADDGVIDPKISELMRQIYLSLKADPGARAILMVGSYRQSMASDVYCLKIKRNGSCFPVYEYILNEFKRINPDFANRISLDKFLLADIKEKKPNGAHFELAVRLSRMDVRRYQAVNESAEPIWHDQTKCGLQYVQMHHLAAQFHSDTIKYCFHDNCDDLILKPSHDYFSKFDFCIPSNVTLTHFCYELGRYKKKSLPIKGLGYIDFDYRENICQFNGALHAPIPQSITASTFQNVSIFAKHDKQLRLTLLRSSGRFFPFGQLIQIKGREYVDKFIGCLKNELIREEFNGYLLHLALNQNNVGEVKALLRRGVNYLALNDQGKHALECALQGNNLDMISCFIEYGGVQKNDKQLMRFVMSMSMIDFYDLIARLIESKSNRSVDILLHSRLNEAAALADYYIKIYLEIKNGTVRCTKKFFSRLMEDIVKNQRVSPMVDDLRRWYFHTLILPGDHFEEPALQALCFFMDEFLKKKCGPIEELIFAMLMLTPEIKEKMRLTNCVMNLYHYQVPLIIENYYQRFLGYQAVMKGKIKEELNDLRIVTEYILSRFSCRESEIVFYLKKHHPDVTWLHPQAQIDKTPKQIILKAIRKQSSKNKGDEQIQAAFLLLQCVVAQAITLPMIVGLLDSWKKIKLDRASDTVGVLLREADDSAGCGFFSFFSPGNMGFLTQLPATIKGLSRHS